MAPLPRDEMVERVSWFSPSHYEILLFFDDHDIRATANVIAENTGYDRSYINRRVRELQQASVLRNDDGIYELSKTGREFLSGELDASELKPPE